MVLHYNLDPIWMKLGNWIKIVVQNRVTDVTSTDLLMRCGYRWSDYDEFKVEGSESSHKIKLCSTKYVPHETRRRSMRDSQAEETSVE